jgi:hypothetical protein
MATPLFGLPEITEGQAGKYITHNETIAMIEGLISRVLSANTGGPPVSPDDGSTYIVDVAIEDWASASVNDIAHYYSGSWHFISPITGFAIWCADQTRRIYYSGTDWVSQTNFLYQAWLDQGNTGTEQDFLDAFKGDKGDTGDSAYQIWLDQGNTGTEQDFLDALKGDKGDTGDTGATGDSAYQVWLDQGNTGTEQDFLDAISGSSGGGATTDDMVKYAIIFG